MLQLTYELRPKWNNNNNKTQNAVSRSDPLQGSDKDTIEEGEYNDIFCYKRRSINLDLPELLLPIRRNKMPPRAVGAVLVAGRQKIY